MSGNNLVHKLPSVFNAEAGADVDCVIQFHLSEPAYVSITGGNCTSHAGIAEAPDLSLTMADDFLEPLLRGEVNGMAALMTGKLKFSGDMALAQRISTLFDMDKL
jgi:putative sterol carrier protein